MVLVFLTWSSALSIVLIRAYRGELWIGKQCKKLTKNDANINSVKLFAILNYQKLSTNKKWHVIGACLVHCYKTDD